MKRKNLSGSSAIHQPFSCRHENGSKLSNPFTWVNIQSLAKKLNAKLPEPLQGMIPASTIHETKLCVTVIMLGVSSLMGITSLLIASIPAFLILTSKEKGSSK